MLSNEILLFTHEQQLSLHLLDARLLKADIHIAGYKFEHIDIGDGP